jgi:hypothetical protein
MGIVQLNHIGDHEWPDSFATNGRPLEQNMFCIPFQCGNIATFSTRNCVLKSSNRIFYKITIRVFLFMARIAVGAVNIAFTLCSSISEVLASECFIGFPSK